ncbi:hypothetical protein CCACVL1_28966 [Corchorus capsularis]|uniref:Uncharacterized protein n=1 Tax=Corchorus capsularis TaxID=210143 RepID=A0A1R3G4F2_COCAP|nr:hypothetical protein CCACVL1_28966 [Corchorus capsularis]
MASMEKKIRLKKNREEEDRIKKKTENLSKFSGNPNSISPISMRLRETRKQRKWGSDDAANDRNAIPGASATSPVDENRHLAAIIVIHSATKHALVGYSRALLDVLEVSS